MGRVSKKKLLHDPEDLPLAKMTRWYHGTHSWSAYQITGGRFAMTVRQMSVPIGRSVAEAKHFITASNLPAMVVRLPNSKTSIAYSLTAVACYWEYLLNAGLLPVAIGREHLWSGVLESLRTEKSCPSQTISDLSETLPVSSVLVATPAVLRLRNRIHLEVLIFPDGEYRISFEAGMKVVNLYPNWLIALQTCSKRMQSLYKLGYSGLSKRCAFDKTKQEVETLSVDDWIIIWEHLASRANSRAAAVLASCARETIPTRVDAVFNKLSR